MLNVAYPMAPVRPDTAGGAEHVLALLDTALVEAGHRSIVVASEGSTVAGTLVSTPRVHGTVDDAARARAWSRQRAAIVQSLRRWRIDIVHMHGFDFDKYLPPPGISVLVTLHLPPGWYPRDIFRLERPHTYLHCVSAAQERGCPPEANLLPVIENGVLVEELAIGIRKRRFAVALGRICPEKGYHIALDAAAKAQVPLLLAGRVYPYEEHQRYFREQILTRLDVHSRLFIGPVGFGRKRRLLTAAQCLTVPSLAPETSSLVAMEALACGTPVIAFPAGALADIVEQGKTGFLVADEHEMGEAILAAKNIDPEACRRAARERFSAERMIRSYLEIYENLTSAGARYRAKPAPPVEARQEDFPRSPPRAIPTRAENHLQVNEITSSQELQPLVREWSFLWENCPWATPFQRPEWLLPWWSRFGRDSRLWIVTLRMRRRLVGLAPLFIRSAGNGHSLREVALIGSGISDYLDVLLEPAVAHTGAEAILQHISRERSRWDVCNFRELRIDSPLLGAPIPHGLRPRIGASDTCPFVPLPESFDALFSGFHPVHRRSLRRARRMLEKSGEICFQEADRESLPQLLDSLFTLHGARWKARQFDGVLADTEIRSFHRQAAEGLLHRGYLRLHALRLNGAVIAVIYAFAAARRLYAYLGGFEPEFERFSPGAVLMEHAMQKAIHDGMQEFDLLRGRERYKYAWGARDRANYRMTLRHC